MATTVDGVSTTDSTLEKLLRYEISLRPIEYVCLGAAVAVKLDVITLIPFRSKDDVFSLKNEEPGKLVASNWLSTLKEIGDEDIINEWPPIGAEVGVKGEEAAGVNDEVKVPSEVTLLKLDGAAIDVAEEEANKRDVVDEAEVSTDFVIEEFWSGENDAFEVRIEDIFIGTTELEEGMLVTKVVVLIVVVLDCVLVELPPDIEELINEDTIEVVELDSLELFIEEEVIDEIPWESVEVNVTDTVEFSELEAFGEEIMDVVEVLETKEEVTEELSKELEEEIDAVLVKEDKMLDESMTFGVDTKEDEEWEDREEEAIVVETLEEIMVDDGEIVEVFEEILEVVGIEDKLEEVLITGIQGDESHGLQASGIPLGAEPL